jgi:hypothetical protein
MFGIGAQVAPGCAPPADEARSTPMDKDDARNDTGPDTVQLKDDAAPWASTHTDDVFDPAVRVALGWHDVAMAVELGAVVPDHAHALWAGWAAQGGPHRLAPPMAAKPAAVQPAAPPVAPGASSGVLLGCTLAGAVAGALLSYLVFAA